MQVAELTGCRLHVAHLSARASLELVRAAKQRGLRVSCEVTPHHFTLSDEDVVYDTHFKMNPPLAAAEDRAALIEGLADGTVDAIATDHAPHEPASKASGIRSRAFRRDRIRDGAGAGAGTGARRANLRCRAWWSCSPPVRRACWDAIAASPPANQPTYIIFHRCTRGHSAPRNPPANRATRPSTAASFAARPMATIVAGRVVYLREG